MSETLKINDELSIEIFVRYKHGEKYVLIYEDVFRLKVIEAISDILEIDKLCLHHAYKREPRRNQSRIAYDFLCCFISNILSIQVNQGTKAYSILPIVDWWKLWNTNEWKMKIQLATDAYTNSEGYWLQNDFVSEENEDILFPFTFRIKSYIIRRDRAANNKVVKETREERNGSLYIHFDVFIFLLYLKYPQFKNDLIRFLKYQPICTLPSEELYIHTLKQANKELLKQLDSANEELSIRSKMKATEVEEMKANYEKEIDDLTKENETLNLTSKQLTETINKLNSKNEALNSQLASANNLNNENNDLITSLRLQLEDKTNENNELTNQLADYKSKYETLKQKLSSLIE